MWSAGSGHFVATCVGSNASSQQRNFFESMVYGKVDVELRYDACALDGLIRMTSGNLDFSRSTSGRASHIRADAACARTRVPRLSGEWLLWPGLLVILCRRTSAFSVYCGERFQLKRNVRKICLGVRSPIVSKS